MKKLFVNGVFGTFVDCNDGIELKWVSKDRTKWVRMLQLVRNLPRRVFDSVGKCWVIPNTEANIVMLKESGWRQGTHGVSTKISGGGVKKISEGEKRESTINGVKVPKKYRRACFAEEVVQDGDPLKSQRDAILGYELDEDKELIPGLRPYQIDFLKFAEMKHGRVMLGDGMGTGKTLQALSWLCYNRSFPALIVVNAPTKLQWKKEFRRWLSKVPGCPSRSQLLNGRKPYALEAYSSVIVNWDILYDWKDVLSRFGFKCIVGDEAQAIGNPKSKRSIAFMQLASTIPECIVMSGTPARSRPAQFWTMSHCVDPLAFPDYDEYLWRYTNPERGMNGVTFDGVRREKELHGKLLKIMLRRTKEEVMQFLPKKTIEVIPLDSDKKAMEEYIAQERMCEGSNNLHEQLMNVMRTAFPVKERAMMDWIHNFLDNSNEKLVVFAWHRNVVDILYENLKEYNPAKIYGGVDLRTRESEKAKFHDDPTCRVIVGNIQSLGTGVDGLQDVCCNVVFAEFSTTSTDMSQAMDRLHRGGQERPVFVYYMVAPGTIDEDMVEVLDERTKVLAAVLDGKEACECDLLADVAARRGLKLY